MLFLFLICGVTLGVISAAIPSSYVLQVDHLCSETADGASQVDILTDLSVKVKVACKDREMLVSSADQVEYHFKAYYEGNSSEKCIFKQRTNSGIYVLLVSVGWAEPKDAFKPKEEKYLVTCNLDPYAVNQSAVHDTRPGLLGPVELQDRMGQKSPSGFTLEVTDIAGNPLATHIDIGRKVQLRAHMSPAKNESGFRAVTCNAVSGSMKYAVLRGGCGDGIVFPPDIGFITDNLDVYSPFFDAFKLRDGSFISFDCNFTSCAHSCNGDSCQMESRRKREANENMDSEQVITLTSGTVNVVAPVVADPQKIEDLKQHGIHVIPESCLMTKQGLECKTRHTFNTNTTTPYDDYYGLLALSLILFQALVAACMVAGIVVAGRQHSWAEKIPQKNTA